MIDGGNRVGTECGQRENWRRNGSKWKLVHGRGSQDLRDQNQDHGQLHNKTLQIDEAVPSGVNPNDEWKTSPEESYIQLCTCIRCTC